MAASSAIQSVEQVDKVSLRVLVDKERNKVVYAEAGKDFVDVLFSFLTLPLGTIARLVSKESNIETMKFGSISSLYQSVTNFDEQYLCSHTCKEMLLQPRNSMETYCQQLKLNIDDTPAQYFICGNWDCRRKGSECLLSIFRNKKCYCGNVMNKEVFPECLNIEKGFFQEIASFIICDDLYVMPNVFGASLHLLQKLGHDRIDTIEEQTVDINKKEVVDLLKLSLLSKSPLTDFILKKNQSVDKLNLRNNLEFLIGEQPSDEDKLMSVKVTIRKSNEKILFVEAEADFVDLIFSFLTFPLGGVLNMLQGFSSIRSMDNLYKSLFELNPDIYLISQGLKDKLTNPLIAAQFELSNQILPITAALLHMNYCHTYYDHNNRCVTNLTKEIGYANNKDKYVRFKLVDPKYSSAKSSYARGPSMYMVTDDLFVSPMSSVSALSYLKSLKVPLSDLEERVINVGVKEGLSILKASLISTSALTNGLKQFIKTIKDVDDASTSAISAPQEFNFEALGIYNAPSWTVELPDGSSGGTQVVQVPRAPLVEGLPLPLNIQEPHKGAYEYLFELVAGLKHMNIANRGTGTENPAPVSALRRGTRKRKGGHG